MRARRIRGHQAASPKEPRRRVVHDASRGTVQEPFPNLIGRVLCCSPPRFQKWGIDLRQVRVVDNALRAHMADYDFTNGCHRFRRWPKLVFFLGVQYHTRLVNPRSLCCVTLLVVLQVAIPPDAYIVTQAFAKFCGKEKAVERRRGVA